MANFISCWSRPDITFTVNKLCKYMANPGEVHWKLLKHLLRYLSGTRDLGLYYAFENPALCAGLHGYTDSSFADCPDTSRSTLAYAFFFDNAIVSWYSKLGSFVTTCTNHAEYNALALGAKEAEWLVSVYDHLIRSKHTPVPLASFLWCTTQWTIKRISTYELGATILANWPSARLLSLNVCPRKPTLLTYLPNHWETLPSINYRRWW